MLQCNCPQNEQKNKAVKELEVIDTKPQEATKDKLSPESESLINQFEYLANEVQTQSTTEIMNSSISSIAPSGN